ncbi:MAG TPA: ThuA domain-containing protein, partial [Cellvibrio sp.]
MRIFGQYTLVKTQQLLGLTLLLSLASCGEGTSDTAAPNQSGTTESATMSASQAQSISGARILVFSKTAGWRHDSIPAGIAAFEKLAKEQQFSVVATEDAAVFTDAELSQFNAIVFLNSTLNVLDENQELA